MYIKIIFIAASLLLGVVACQSTTLSPAEAVEAQYEREARRAEMRDLWVRCERYYLQTGGYTVHVDHEHSRITGKVKGGPLGQAWGLRNDIEYNDCEWIIKQLDKQH